MEKEGVVGCHVCSTFDTRTSRTVFFLQQTHGTKGANEFGSNDTGHCSQTTIPFRLVEERIFGNHNPKHMENAVGHYTEEISSET